MAKENTAKKRLNTWKEIANYLDCDKKTCQRWEKKYGMPVYRIDKNAPTRVHSFTDKLDEWLAKVKSDKTRSASLILPKLKISKFLLFLLIIIPISIIFLFAIGVFKDQIPAGFKIEGSTLKIFNKKGKFLWDFPTGIEKLLGDEHYQNHFQFKRMRDIISIPPHIMIKDITNDGRPEIVFSVQTQDEFTEGKIFCFDYRGNQLWDYELGKELTFGDVVISRDYRIYGFDLFDLDNDGKQETIIIADHRHRFPTRLVILNYQGQKLGDYWNSGRLSDLQFVDLNKDGRSEILTSGCNNEYKKGCLIVFDTSRISGSSPQYNEEYICRELDPGTEKYYILFPRTDLDLLEAYQEAITAIDVLENQRILLISLVGRILFELNYDLELTSITFSNQFKQKHKLAKSEEKISSELNEEYEENLRNGILYYDGQNWVSTPTMTSYWKNRSSSR